MKSGPRIRIRTDFFNKITKNSGYFVHFLIGGRITEDFFIIVFRTDRISGIYFLDSDFGSDISLQKYADNLVNTMQSQ